MSPSRTHTFWAQPWDIRQAVLIQGSALLLGFALEWRLWGVERPPVPPPWNWIAATGAAALLTALAALCKNRPWFLWLSSVSFALPALAFWGLTALLGTFFIQTGGMADSAARLGLRHIYSSLPFYASCTLVALNLGAVTTRRCLPWDRRSPVFLLSHGGLLLVLLAAAAGAAQFHRIRLVLEPGQSVSEIRDEQGRWIALPAALKLERFDRDVFPPQLALAVESPAGGSGFDIIAGKPRIQTGTVLELPPYNIEVLEYLPKARPSGDDFASADDAPWATAAKVRIRSVGGILAGGWLCSGSRIIRPRHLRLAPGVALVMLEAPPKKFRSHLEIQEEGRAARMAVVEVNRPLKIGGWTVYQASWDDRGQPGGPATVLELVSDPSLGLVYCGFGLTFAGIALRYWRATRGTEP